MVRLRAEVFDPSATRDVESGGRLDGVGDLLDAAGDTEPENQSCRTVDRTEDVGGATQIYTMTCMVIIASIYQIM